MSYYYLGIDTPDTLNQIINNVENSTRLDPQDCIASYSPSGFGPHGNVVVITTDSESTGKLYAWGKVDFSRVGGEYVCCNEHYDSVPPWDYPSGGLNEPGGIGDWLCSAGQYPPNITSPCEYQTLDPFSWQIHGHKVDYCLSQTLPEECSIGFIPGIMIVVVLCNALKVATTWYMMTYQRRSVDKNLSSVGDAVASFLRHPDRHSALEDIEDFDTPVHGNAAPARKEERALRLSSRSLDPSNDIDHKLDVVPSDHVQRVGNRWREAVPKILWFLCISMYVSRVSSSRYARLTSELTKINRMYHYAPCASIPLDIYLLQRRSILRFSRQNNRLWARKPTGHAAGPLHSPSDGTRCQCSPAPSYGHLLPLTRRVHSHACGTFLDRIFP